MHRHSVTVYPTWGLGIGRVGSILGPLVGGVLVAANWSMSSLFQAVAVPAVISVAAIIVLCKSAGRSTTAIAENVMVS